MEYTCDNTLLYLVGKSADFCKKSYLNCVSHFTWSSMCTPDSPRLLIFFLSVMTQTNENEMKHPFHTLKGNNCYLLNFRLPFFCEECATSDMVHYNLWRREKDTPTNKTWCQTTYGRRPDSTI